VEQKRRTRLSLLGDNRVFSHVVAEMRAEALMELMPEQGSLLPECERLFVRRSDSTRSTEPPELAAHLAALLVSTMLIRFQAAASSPLNPGGFSSTDVCLDADSPSRGLYDLLRGGRFRPMPAAPLGSGRLESYSR